MSVQAFSIVQPAAEPPRPPARAASETETAFTLPPDEVEAPAAQKPTRAEAETRTKIETGAATTPPAAAGSAGAQPSAQAATAEATSAGGEAAANPVATPLSAGALFALVLAQAGTGVAPEDGAPAKDETEEGAATETLLPVDAAAGLIPTPEPSVAATPILSADITLDANVLATGGSSAIAALPAAAPDAASLLAPTVAAPVPAAAPAIAAGPAAAAGEPGQQTAPIDPAAIGPQPQSFGLQTAAPASNRAAASASAETTAAAAEAGAPEASVEAPAAAGQPAPAEAKPTETLPAETLPAAFAGLDLAAALDRRAGKPDAAAAASLQADGQANAAGDPAQPSAGPSTPLHVVPLEIGLRALSGAKRFEIRLDPAELGRVEVTLDVSDAGEVSARLVVDRVETLHLLQREARTLERAFEQAGLKPSDAGVEISLRDQQGQQQFRQGRDGEAAPRRERAELGVEDDVAAVQAAPMRRTVRLGGVDLSI